jgi:hypothetical protein
MLSFLPSILQYKQYWQGIATTIIIALATKILTWLVETVRNKKNQSHDYKIEGFWIGSCQLPSYGESPSIEVWRYTRKGDKIKLTFFSYSKNSNISKNIGEGIFRGSILSCYYYLQDKSTYESGVVTMVLSGLELKGAYAQFEPKKGHQPYHTSTDYIHKRINLSFRSRLRMTLGGPPLKKYEEAKSVYDRV